MNLTAQVRQGGIPLRALPGGESDRALRAELRRYGGHLQATSGWLLSSVRPDGGSAGYFSPVSGWSRSYPETTGYIIPTLLRLASTFAEERYRTAAVQAGQWLLSIQQSNG